MNEPRAEPPVKPTAKPVINKPVINKPVIKPMTVRIKLLETTLKHT
jgi:hypothetical protein